MTDQPSIVDPAVVNPSRPARSSVAGAPMRQRIGRSDAARFIAPMVIAIVLVSLYTNNKNGNFLSSENVKNILLQVAVLGIIAIGQTFLIAAGQLDLSVATLAALAGVIAATVVTDGGSEAWAFGLVLGICVVVGLAWGGLVSALRIPPFILTLGGASVFASLALRIAKSSPVPVRDQFEWLGRMRIWGLPTPVWFFLLVTIGAAFVMRYTRFGRHVYATGSNEEAAFLTGIPTARTKVLCFVISSTLAGFAGLIAMARISTGDPRVGGELALQAIAAVVLGGATLAGGRGSPLGTFVGVVLLGVVQSALTFNNVQTFWNDAVFGAVLIFAVVVTALGDLRRRRTGARSALVDLTPPSPDVVGASSLTTASSHQPTNQQQQGERI